MSALAARVDRVLGAGPFREIGQPRVAATSPDGTLVVVGGALDWPQWHGHDLAERSESDPGWHPLAVYRSDDLTCRYQLTVQWPANAIAFHPTLPLVAIGTGSYDGGWFYEGELLLLDLTTGAVISLLEDPREVRRIAWRDAETLDLVLAIPCDGDLKRLGSPSLACSIRRDDWGRATEGMLRIPRGKPVPGTFQPDPGAAATVIEQLCQARGKVWAPRGAGWTVQAIADGRILAASEGIGLECWSTTSGKPLWRLPTDSTGYQIRVLPDGRTALVLTQAPSSSLLEVDLDVGSLRKTHRAPFSAVLVAGADGWWALRDTRHDSPAGPGNVLLQSPAGVPAATVPLGRYDLFNHFFDIRYAPELLFLQGHGREPGRDKWVVSVDAPDGRVRRLFPLEWDASRGGHLFGGSGAYLDDPSGPALVHTGVVHDGAGLLPGNSFVVRRAYPIGEPQWVFTADHQATALDADNDFVYVVFNSGELVVLRAEDGAVHARQELRVDGHRVVPLSLSRVSAGRLAVGTLDGRILDCSLPAAGQAP